MTVSLTLSGDANEVLNDMAAFLERHRAPANYSVAAGFGETPAAVVPEPTVAAAGAKPGRKKAPAADVVIEQPAQTEKAAEPTDGLTVDEAREHMKKFAADGHMDQVSAALESFGVKKVSDIDPDAKGAKSAKFSEFVAKIDELVKAKVAA